jgi:peptide chain release factor subunit 1
MISWKDVKQLLAYENGSHWVSTLSLNVDGRRFPRRKEFMVVYKNLLKQARADLESTALSSETRQSIEEDFKKMERYLGDQFGRNHHRGVLIYSCSQKGLWLPFAFPVPLRSKLVILPHPYTLPLTALLDQYPKYAVVLVSQERARIFEVYLGEIIEHSEIDDELPGKVQDTSSKEYKSMDEYGLAERRIERRGRRSESGAGGYSESGVYGLAERKIERHIETHVRHHFKRIADITFTYFRDHRFDWLIIGGQEENRSGFEETLHHDLKKRIIGRIKADPKFSLSDVHEETLKLIQEVELNQKDQLVKKIAEANQPYGLGVFGVTPTLHALGQGAVQTLVVQEGVELSGGRCPSCGHLNTGDATCPHCGAPTDPVADLVEETIEQAISQSAQIAYISRHPILERSGGMGALLRYQPAKNTNLAKGAA